MGMQISLQGGDFIFKAEFPVDGTVVRWKVGQREVRSPEQILEEGIGIIVPCSLSLLPGYYKLNRFPLSYTPCHDVLPYHRPKSNGAN
jgi:hypothetical protein